VRCNHSSDPTYGSALEKFDIGDGITLELVEVTFRIDSAAEDMTRVIFKEPHKLLGVSSDTGRRRKQEDDETPKHTLRGGIFVVTLHRHQGLTAGKQFDVLLEDDV
jgi:hypothetical protein